MVTRLGFKPGKVHLNFSLLKDIQTGSGAQTTSYSMGMGGFFPRGKAAGACG